MNVKYPHQFCTENKKSILQSENCGCFYCLNIFPAIKVKNFLETEDTALCPICDIDSVLADKDISFDKELLEAMYDHWFS